MKQSKHDFQEQINTSFKFVFSGCTEEMSCILLMIDPDRFQPIHDVTVGVTFSIKTIQIDGRDVKLQLWDASQVKHIFKSRKNYFNESACTIIIYDIEDPSALKNIQSDVQDAREYSPKDCHIVIAGNRQKQDAKSYYEEQVKSYAKAECIPYYEISSYYIGFGIKELFDDCVKEVYEQYIFKKKNEFVSKSKNEKLNNTQTCLNRKYQRDNENRK